MNEEGLRDWFGKSKSKSGKKGWVQVVSGNPVLVNPDKDYSQVRIMQKDINDRC